jgi:hypothetical protein
MPSLKFNPQLKKHVDAMDAAQRALDAAQVRLDKMKGQAAQVRGVADEAAATLEAAQAGLAKFQTAQLSARAAAMARGQPAPMPEKAPWTEATMEVLETKARVADEEAAVAEAAAAILERDLAIADLVTGVKDCRRVLMANMASDVVAQRARVLELIRDELLRPIEALTQVGVGDASRLGLGTARNGGDGVELENEYIEIRLLRSYRGTQEMQIAAQQALAAFLEEQINLLRSAPAA